MLAFAVATLGSLAGTLVAWAATSRWLAGGGAELAGARAVAAALCASYVGGSLNFAAVIQVCTSMNDLAPRHVRTLPHPDRRTKHNVA